MATNFAHSTFTWSGTVKGYLNGLNGVNRSQFNGYQLINSNIIDSFQGKWGLCWAGTSANMLTWTGWGKKVLNLTKKEQSIFDYFFNHSADDNARDAGYNQFLGISWFFNGSFKDINVWKPDSNKSGNLIGISASSYLKHYPLQGKDSQGKYCALPNMQRMIQSLKEGDAVGLDINVDGTPTGGHAITCWGYTYNSAYNPTDYRYYTGLYISNSAEEGNGNSIEYFELKWDAGQQCYYLDLWCNYYSGYNFSTGKGKLYSFTSLDRQCHQL